mmetsp:Transcript_30514/g.39158  ORF Transcript_30514/g.39158 Transcript_30514/m.39158 type:complete len:321 (+) Transcript_30514:62-1024(+)
MVQRGQDHLFGGFGHQSGRRSVRRDREVCGSAQRADETGGQSGFGAGTKVEGDCQRFVRIRIGLSSIGPERGGGIGRQAESHGGHGRFPQQRGRATRRGGGAEAGRTVSRLPQDNPRGETGAGTASRQEGQLHGPAARDSNEGGEPAPAAHDPRERGEGVQHGDVAAALPGRGRGGARGVRRGVAARVARGGSVQEGEGGGDEDGRAGIHPAGDRGQSADGTDVGGAGAQVGGGGCRFRRRGRRGSSGRAGCWPGRGRSVAAAAAAGGESNHGERAAIAASSAGADHGAIDGSSHVATDVFQCTRTRGGSNDGKFHSIQG